MSLSCLDTFLNIHIYLVVNTESVLFHFYLEIFFFGQINWFKMYIGFGKAVVDSGDLLRVSAGKSVAHLLHSDRTWPVSPQYLEVIACFW